MLSQQTPTNDAPLPDQLSREIHAPLAPSDKVPNLIVIGAMKASTTTFYELITRHPNIWFPSEKEPHYFTSPDYGKPKAWQEYLQLFDAPPSAIYIGEASTGYSKLPHFGNTPVRLQQTHNHPKFIYLVRDPVQRTVSNYQHSYLTGHYAEGTTLTEAVENDPILIDASCYARQIRAYWQVFGKEALLILPTDQLHAEPTDVMQLVEAFLKLPPFEGWETSLPQSNSRQALNQSLKLQAVLPKPLLNLLRKLLPAPMRDKLKNLATSPPALPPVTDADRQFVFTRLADDLRDLLTILDEAPLPWLASWPSVQLLGSR